MRFVFVSVIIALILSVTVSAFAFYELLVSSNYGLAILLFSVLIILSLLLNLVLEGEMAMLLDRSPRSLDLRNLSTNALNQSASESNLLISYLPRRGGYSECRSLKVPVNPGDQFVVFVHGDERGLLIEKQQSGAHEDSDMLPPV